MSEKNSPPVTLQERGGTSQTFWQKSKRFFEPFLHDWNIYFVACFTYFLSAFNIAVYILFIEGIIGTLESGNQEMFYSMMLFFILYYIGYFILKVLLRKKGWPAHSTTARKYIQNKYIPKFVRLDNNEIERLGTGKIIAIIDKGIIVWGNLFHHVFDDGIRILVSVLFTSYMIGKNSTTLLGVFVLLYIFIYIASFYLNFGTLKHRRKRRDWGNTHTKHLVKIIMSKNEILLTNKADGEIQSLDSYFDKETFYNKKMANYLMPMFELPRMVITGLIIFVLYYFGNKYFAGELQLSEIAGLSTAFVVMLNTINRGVEFFKDFTKDFTEIEKFWNFFDTTPQIEGYEEGNTFEFKKGEIKLKNISYGYDDNKKVFENFSTTLQGGNITALVGPSGGGKTTLVKLIAGYIRANSGEIEIDRQKLSETSLKSYYSQVGYLTQEPSVFDGTIRENLMYAVTPPHPTSPKLGEEQNVASSSLIQGGIEVGRNLEKIIDLAQCGFIYDLPNGLDTEIGERGIKLSGGQKQRLAIAKIFLKNPKIIILDEPTSALDSVSELKITQALNNLFKDRTVLVIAHRLQTVKHADDILVIESGKIIERGTHKSLVKEKGFYKQMLDLQSGF